jgi:hypothetical protein
VTGWRRIALSPISARTFGAPLGRREALQEVLALLQVLELLQERRALFLFLLLFLVFLARTSRVLRLSRSRSTSRQAALLVVLRRRSWIRFISSWMRFSVGRVHVLELADLLDLLAGDRSWCRSGRILEAQVERDCRLAVE